MTSTQVPVSDTCSVHVVPIAPRFVALIGASFRGHHGARIRSEIERACTGHRPPWRLLDAHHVRQLAHEHRLVETASQIEPVDVGDATRDTRIALRCWRERCHLQQPAYHDWAGDDAFPVRSADLKVEVPAADVSGPVQTRNVELRKPVVAASLSVKLSESPAPGPVFGIVPVPPRSQSP